MRYALVIRAASNPAMGALSLTRSGTTVLGADDYAASARLISNDSSVSWTPPLVGGVSTDLQFKIYLESGYSTAGSETSALKFANPGPNLTPNWGTISWNAVTPANAALSFQVAASNDPDGSVNFVVIPAQAGIQAQVSKFIKTRVIHKISTASANWA